MAHQTATANTSNLAALDELANNSTAMCSPVSPTHASNSSKHLTLLSINTACTPSSMMGSTFPADASQNTTSNPALAAPQT
jgi:hypothetical protein